MPTCFLTGVTGFLGAHAARALLSEGWKVRALVRRDPSSVAGLRGLPIEAVRGDLSGAGDLPRGLAGCEAIVHVAGLVTARSLEEYRGVNVEGTERLLRAAARAVPHALFLFVSSQAAAGPARDGRPVREGDEARPVSWYGLSKKEAEEMIGTVWGGPWIVLRPSVVYGPGDRGMLLLFRAAARGWIPVPVGRSRIQLIGADRAALAIARSTGRRDLSGRRLFLADPEPIAIRDLARILSRLPERAARLVPVPDLCVRLAGWEETLRGKLTGQTLAFTSDKARELLAGDWLCDAAPTATDLRLPPLNPPLEEGLRATWAWYLREGWLRL